MSVLDPVKAGENIAILKDYYENSDTVDLYRNGDRLELLDFSGCCCVWFSRLIKRFRGFTKVDAADRLGETARLVDLYATSEFVKSFANNSDPLTPILDFVNKLQRAIVYDARAKLPRDQYGNLASYDKQVLPLNDVITRMYAVLFKAPAPIPVHEASAPIPVPGATGRERVSPPTGDGSSLAGTTLSMPRSRSEEFSPWGYFVGTLSKEIPRYFSRRDVDAFWEELRPRREDRIVKGIIKENFTKEETETHFRAALEVADRNVKIRINRETWESREPGLKRRGIPDFALRLMKAEADFTVSPSEFERHIKLQSDAEIDAASMRCRNFKGKLFNAYNEIAIRVGVPALPSPDQIPYEWFFDSELDRNFPCNLIQLIFEKNRFPKNIDEVYTRELGLDISHASGIIILEQDRPAAYNQIAATINQRIFGVGMIANYF